MNNDETPPMPPGADVAGANVDNWLDILTRMGTSLGVMEALLSERKPQEKTWTFGKMLVYAKATPVDGASELHVVVSAEYDGVTVGPENARNLWNCEWDLERREHSRREHELRLQTWMRDTVAAERQAAAWERIAAALERNAYRELETLREVVHPNPQKSRHPLLELLAEATHRCKVCGALWRMNELFLLNPPQVSWSRLAPAMDGVVNSCCDVSVVDHVEPLPWKKK